MRVILLIMILLSSFQLSFASEEAKEEEIVVKQRTVQDEKNIALGIVETINYEIDSMNAEKSFLEKMATKCPLLNADIELINNKIKLSEEKILKVDVIVDEIDTLEHAETSRKKINEIYLDVDNLRSEVKEIASSAKQQAISCGKEEANTEDLMLTINFIEAMSDSYDNEEINMLSPDTKLPLVLQIKGDTILLSLHVWARGSGAINFIDKLPIELASSSKKKINLVDIAGTKVGFIWDKKSESPADIIAEAGTIQLELEDTFSYVTISDLKLSLQRTENGKSIKIGSMSLKGPIEVQGEPPHN